MANADGQTITIEALASGRPSDWLLAACWAR
jgi:hypothetical protein